MPDKKISELDPAGALTGDELVPVVSDPGGTPATEVTDLDDVADFVEAENASAPRPGDAATMTAIGDAQSAADAAASAASAAAGVASAAASAASSAASAAATAQTTANLAATKIQVERLVSANTTVGAAQNQELLVVDMGGSDIGVGFQSTCVGGHVEQVLRTWTAGTPDPGGEVLFVSASGTHVFQGADRITGARAMATLKCLGVQLGTHYWNVTIDASDEVDAAPHIQAAQTATTRVLAATDSGEHIPLDASSNAIDVEVDDSLFESLGEDRGFRCSFEVVDDANAITFTGTGGVTITYSGKDPGVTPFATGDFIELFMSSATKCRITTAVEL